MMRTLSCFDKVYPTAFSPRLLAVLAIAILFLGPCARAQQQPLEDRERWPDEISEPHSRALLLPQGPGRTFSALPSELGALLGCPTFALCCEEERWWEMSSRTFEPLELTICCPPCPPTR